MEASRCFNAELLVAASLGPHGTAALDIKNGLDDDRRHQGFTQHRIIPLLFSFWKATTTMWRKQYQIRGVAASTSLCSLLQTRRDSPGPQPSPRAKEQTKAKAQSGTANSPDTRSDTIISNHGKCWQEGSSTDVLVDLMDLHVQVKSYGTS
jgi:hypothetical protein